MAVRVFLTSLFVAASLCVAEATAFRAVDGQQLPPQLKAAANMKLPTAGTKGKMYMMSDLHYDPFYGTVNAVGTCNSASTSPKYGTITCDSNLPLITTAMDDLFDQASQDSDAIFLLLGDLPRHNLDVFANNAAAGNYYAQYAKPLEIAAEVTNTIASMVSERMSKIQTAIPHADILGAFGNNDCVPHYFEEKLNNPAALVNFTTAFQKNGLITAAEQQVWKNCGYFSRLVNTNPSADSIQKTPLLILNINSVLYAPQSNVNANGTIGDPCGQFAWMASEVERARNNGWKVIVVGHVIPMSKKWNDNYLQTYTSFLKVSNNVISAQFFSHTHMFTFVTLTKDDSTPPVFDIPSISPVDGNNPSYVSVTFNADWQVNEIHHRYLSEDQTQWVDGQVFGKDFGLTSPITNSQLYNYAKNTLMPLDKKDPQWQKFLALYEGGFASSTMDNGNKEKLKIICKMISLYEGDYELCKTNNGVSA